MYSLQDPGFEFKCLAAINVFKPRTDIYVVLSSVTNINNPYLIGEENIDANMPY